MAIQNRRGVYKDFTPTKMVPGELAVVQSGDPNNTSGKAVYAAFGSSGDVKRLATEDDLSKKVDKVTGKGLSTNDYTTAEKNKLSGIASGAEVNVQSNWNQTNTSADDFIKNKPTKTSDFTNDGDGTSNFATQQYVQQNGGKIDTISVNGTQQTITNKNVDIAVPIIDSTLSQTGKAADAKAVGDSLASGLETKAPAITNTASGSIAHFEDGADANAKSVIAHIEPVQDLHGYDSPWPAGGGKNLLDIKRANSTTNGITFTKQYDDSGNCIGVLANGTATSNAYFDFNVAGSEIQTTDLIDGQEYVFSGLPSTGSASTFRLRIGNSTGSSITYTNNVDGLTFEKTSEMVIFGVQIFSGYTANNLLIKPMIRLATETDPTFTPYSNICPISGFTGMNVIRTGKNLIQLSKQTVTSKGIQFTPNEDGSITINGTNDGTGASFTRVVEHVRLKPGTYKKTLVQNDCYVYVQYIINSTTWTIVPGGISSSDEFTIEEGMDYDLAIRIGVKVGTTVDNFTYYPYIYPADETDLTFDPPKRNVINVTFPSEAGTVYGGYVDVTNGKLVVTHGFLSITSVTRWSTYNHCFYTNYCRNLGFITGDMTSGLRALCNTLPNKSNKNNEELSTQYAFKHIDRFYLFIQDADTAQEANTWLSNHPTQVCAQLTTPIIYDVSPIQIATLLGVNNIWNDCNGDTDVEYKADTKLYIEQLTKPTEDDMTANGNIANGTFFMIGNRLFLSTASIAVGETIVPGTNCTELSLAEALNNLNA